MSNRFTSHDAAHFRTNGWLDKEQADALRTRLAEVEVERDEANADAAVMRGALLKACEWYDDKHEYAVDFFEDIKQQLTEALATNAGKSLLLRLQAAEWLLDHCPDSLDPNPMVNKQWWSRRDTFLNPKPQDVM